MTKLEDHTNYITFTPEYVNSHKEAVLIVIGDLVRSANNILKVIERDIERLGTKLLDPKYLGNPVAEKLRKKKADLEKIASELRKQISAIEGKRNELAKARRRRRRRNK